MSTVKRLPIDSHRRAMALVKDSMPRRDYRNFPEEAARTMRNSAAARALSYAALEDVSDECVRMAEAIEFSDGVVVDLSNDADARSVRVRLQLVEDALTGVTRPE